MNKEREMNVVRVMRALGIERCFFFFVKKRGSRTEGKDHSQGNGF